MRIGDMPAFARSGLYNHEVNYEPSTGLTKREYFAAMMVTAAIKTPLELDDPRRTIYGLVVRNAVEMADALLAELERTRS